jgi:hypothetical protein
VSDNGIDDGGLRWVGWVRARKGAPWQKVVEADGMGQAARLLAAEADRRGVPARHFCQTTGAVPRLQDGPLTEGIRDVPLG